MVPTRRYRAPSSSRVAEREHGGIEDDHLDSELVLAHVGLFEVETVSLERKPQLDVCWVHWRSQNFPIDNLDRVTAT